MFGGTFQLTLWDVQRVEGVVRKATPATQQTYQFSPVSLQGSETLDNWIRQRHMRAVEKSTETMEPVLRRQVLVDAANEAAYLTWNSKRGVELMQCVEGISMIAAVCIQQNHPTVDINYLREMICLRENLEEVTRVFKESKEQTITALAFQHGKKQAPTLNSSQKKMKQGRKR